MADCGCGSTETILRLSNADGTFTYPPVIDDVVTIPNPADETEFTAVQGNGILITPGGAKGHGPTVAVRPSPTTPLPITFDSFGRLQVGPQAASPSWSSPGSNGAIRVIPGGTQGHTPTFALLLDPASPVPVSVSSAGLSVGPAADSFSCDKLASCSVSAFGDVVGFEGRSEGDVLTVNALGEITPAAPCCTNQGTPIDALGNFPANAPAPAGFDSFHQQTVLNGLTGEELWVVLADTAGAKQWHQIA